MSQAPDDEHKQKIAGLYYDGEISFEELRELVGWEAAENIRILDKQLSKEYIEELAAELAESDRG